MTRLAGICAAPMYNWSIKRLPEKIPLTQRQLRPIRPALERSRDGAGFKLNQRNSAAAEADRGISSTCDRNVATFGHRITSNRCCGSASPVQSVSAGDQVDAFNHLLNTTCWGCHGADIPAIGPGDGLPRGNYPPTVQRVLVGSAGGCAGDIAPLVDDRIAVDNGVADTKL